jgi:glycosyltransferase involved in cell wall biosynthesis
MHEPYKTRKHNYSPQKRLLILLREYLQSSSLIYLDHVILPSQLAVSLFSKRYPKYRGQTHYAPLLIPELGQSTRKVERKCFSYVGNIHSATGFDKFVNLVQYVRNYELDFHFSIITSSNIPLQLKKIIAHNLSRVNCINKDVILDREIYDLVERSIGVFRLDQEITQSGIIPICFMLGTPVIVNDLAGFTQHVQHGYNGYVIQDITDYNNMILGMKYLQDNFNDLSRNARQSFESIWSKDNWERYYSWLIK